MNAGCVSKRGLMMGTKKVGTLSSRHERAAVIILQIPIVLGESGSYSV